MVSNPEYIEWLSICCPNLSPDELEYIRHAGTGNEYDDVIVPFLGKDWLAPIYVTLDLDSELVTREVEPIVPKKPKYTISPIDSSIVYYEPPKERYIYSIHNKKGRIATAPTRLSL